MTVMFARSLLAFVVAAWAATCGPLSASAASFTDAAGRVVDVPDDVKRIMPAGPPAAVLLYALAPGKMAGWVRPFSADEKAFLAAPWRDLPVTGRLTGKEGDADAETVKKVKPDLIVDVGTVSPEYAELADRIQKETGVPYVLIDGSLAKTPETLRALGAMLGETDNAEALAKYAESALARTQAAVAEQPADGKLLVYYGRGKDGLETGGAGSINTEFLGTVGAKNVAEGEGKGGLTKVTIDQIAAWKPYVILTLDATFQQAALTDPAWSAVTAAKEKRVYRAPALPFGWIDSPPGVNRLIGLDWLVATLYPQQAKIDLKQQARDFYHLFYHVDLSDEQLSTLLDGTSAK